MPDGPWVIGDIVVAAVVVLGSVRWSMYGGNVLVVSGASDVGSVVVCLWGDVAV